MEAFGNPAIIGLREASPQLLTLRAAQREPFLAQRRGRSAPASLPHTTEHPSCQRSPNQFPITILPQSQILVVSLNKWSFHSTPSARSLSTNVLRFSCRRGAAKTVTYAASPTRRVYAVNVTSCDLLIRNH